MNEKNLKKNFIMLFVLLFGIMSAGNVNGSINRDFIKIKSITPDANLQNGVEQQFTVTVEYFLATRNQGILYVGFNTNERRRYKLVSAQSGGALIVGRGNGVHTFNVTALTKDWEDANFGVYVNLSPYPHEASWSPLAFEVKDLSFKN